MAPAIRGGSRFGLELPQKLGVLSAVAGGLSLLGTIAVIVSTFPEWSKTGQMCGATMLFSPLAAIGAARFALGALLVGQEKMAAILSLAVVFLWLVAVACGICALAGLIMAALVAVLPALVWVVWLVCIVIGFLFGAHPLPP